MRYIQLMWFARVWIPLAIAITLMCVLLYAAIQQNYRQSLNDPQIQIAEDVAQLVRYGSPASSLVPKQKVDIARSLSPWFAIYDATGTPVASSGVLNGSMPKPPVGIFDDLRSGKVRDAGVKASSNEEDVTQTGENRLSWQPQSDVRQAIVVVQAGDGFVVAGRNMREVERRIWDMESMIAIGWIAMLAATLIAVWLGSFARDFITFVRD